MQIKVIQMNSELLDKTLEDDIISLSGEESEVGLLGQDLGLDLEEDLDITKSYSILGELMNNPPTHAKPSKQAISPSEHLPFTFYFIPNRPNYISKLNLSMNLAGLCTEIQRIVELSIRYCKSGRLFNETE